MRVTLPLKYDQTVRDLNQKNSQLSKLTSQVSSGKRLNRPSDDPLGWAQAMSIKRGLEDLNTFQSNVDYAIHWHRAAENTLDQLSEQFLRAKDVAIQAMGISSPEVRQAHMEQLEQVFQEAFSLANSRHENRFLFAVNSSQAPFSLVPGETGVDEVQGPPDVSELSETFHVRTGFGLSQAVGLDGQDLFHVPRGEGTVNSLQILLDLKQAVSRGDRDAITEEMEQLDRILENLGRQTATVGSRQAALDVRREALESLSLEEQIRLSELEDNDLLSTLSQIQAKTTAFEAALKVTGLLQGLTLANYI